MSKSKAKESTLNAILYTFNSSFNLQMKAKFKSKESESSLHWMASCIRLKLNFSQGNPKAMLDYGSSMGTI